MFKNYFKTALRTFGKNKITTVINVLGLSIGISAALIIFMVIQYDFSFDKYEPNRQNIYRIVTDGEYKNSGVAVPLYRSLPGISGIQNAATLLQSYQSKVSIPQGNNMPDNIFKKQEDIVYTDGNYFDIFPHEPIAGNLKYALQNPYSVVLSESRARQYFPNVSPEKLIGSTLSIDDTIPVTVTAIVKDLKPNSDFEYKTFISLATISTTNLKKNFGWDEWHNTNSAYQIMVKLSPGAQPATINQQIAAIYKEHADSDDKAIRRLQPLSDVHFNTDFYGVADLSTVRNLILLAVFLLLLGAINFINLSTAQATQRAKEIGIRKTLGSKKSQLIFQFLSETFLLTFFTALLSVAITPLLLKAFKGFIPENLHFSYLYSQPMIWAFFLLLIILVSVISGLYPAFILTKFQPAMVLKNNVVTNSGVTRGAWMRKTLIIFQFIIAQVFIIGVIVVDKQIHYSLQKDMGFRQNAIINFYVPRDFYKPNNKKFVLKDELSKIPGIEEVSLGNQSPAFNGSLSTSVSYKEKNKDIKLNVDMRSGDTAFLGVYDIKLIAGRNIMPSDSATEFLINETLARQLGFKEPADAVGHFLSYNGAQKPIVGVMKDFNLASVRSAIHPLIYFAQPKRGYVMHVALQPNPGTWSSAINKMQAAWKGIYPDVDFDYSFLDKKISDFYKKDQELSTLLTWSAAVAIFISCLGLLGLVIFITNNRIKEIGIRKILGASVRQIIGLLSVDFVKLVAIAFVVAIPVAWWATHIWLQNFAFHTNLSWWIFLLSGVVMITAALIILGVKVGKAAMATPVKSLRSE